MTRSRRRTMCLICCVLIACLAGPVLADDVETARGLADEGWWDEAEAMFDRLLEEDDSNPEVLIGLARIYLMRLYRDKEVDWGRMEDYAKEAIDLDPGNASYYMTLGDILGTKAMKGSKLKAMGRAKDARKALEEAVRIEPDNIDARFWLVYFHIQAPGIAGGDKDEALRQAEAVARIDSVTGYLARAVIEENIEEDYAAAEAALLKAIASGREDAEPFFEYGHFCARRGDFARAESISVDLLARPWCPDSTRKRVHESLGFVHLSTKRWDDAVVEFENALEIDPGDASVSYHIGRTLVFAEADLDRAEDIFKAYLDLPRLKGWWPDKAGAHYRLAQVYDLKGDSGLAREEVDKALKLDPDLEPARDLKKELKRRPSAD